MISRAFGRRVRAKTGRLFGPLYFLYLLVDDRKSFRFFPRWIRSFHPSTTSVRDGIPWLPFELIDWLDHHLNGQMNVFEFGSGGSTIYMAERVKNLFTVEHSPAWYQTVASELKRRKLMNVTYLLREPEPAGPNPLAEYWDNYRAEYPNMSFERYVKAIDEHPDHFFDVVLVDGRARKFCLEHSVSKLRPGGYLLLDNSSTREYLDFLVPLEKYPRFDIASICPFWPPAKWQSSGWQIL
jgi:hypothetical protein